MFPSKKRTSYDFTTDGVAGSYSLSTPDEVVKETVKNGETPLTKNPPRNYDKPLEFIKQNSLKEKENKRFSLQNEHTRRGSFKNEAFASKVSSCKDSSQLTRRERLSSLDGVPPRTSLHEEALTKSAPVKRSKSLKKRLSLKITDLQNSFEKISLSKSQHQNQNNTDAKPPEKGENTSLTDEKDSTPGHEPFSLNPEEDFEPIIGSGANTSLLEEVLSETSLNLSANIQTITEEIHEETKQQQQQQEDQSDENRDQESELKDEEDNVIFKKCVKEKK